MTPEDAAGRAGSGSAEAPVDPADATAPASAVEAELAALRDRHLRLLADQENARRRAQREREEIQRFAAAEIARDLLATLDDLGRARDAAQSAGDPASTALVSGIASIERGLLDTLARHGVRRIDALGEAFDPNRHDALFEVGDTAEPAGTIVTVVRPGYLLHERLLRPAGVGVARAPEAPRGAPERE